MSRLDLLPKLKQKLLAATDFGDVLTYFFDHFGEDPKFMKMGKPVRDPLLERLLLETAGNALGARVMISELLLINFPQYHFTHGPVRINGQMGNFFFFDDVKVGLLSIVNSATNETKMARFSAMAVPASMTPN